MATTQRTKASLASTIEAIGRLREEVEVKLHLARMDTRDAWASLLPDIRAIENNLKALSVAPPENRPSTLLIDEARLQTHLALMNVRDAWQKIEPKISPIIDHLTQAGAAVVDALRTTEEQGAKKATIASKERDVIRRKMEKEAKARRLKVRADLARAQASIEAAANDAIGQIRLGIESLRDSFSRSRAAKPRGARTITPVRSRAAVRARPAVSRARTGAPAQRTRPRPRARPHRHVTA